MKTTKLINCIVLILLVTVAQSFAFSYRSCLGSPIGWAGESATMRASAVTFPTGNAFRTALQESVNVWNQNPSDFRFGLQFGDTSVGVGNFQNEVWATGNTYWLGTAPAVCVYWDYCINLAEADVMFATSVSWTASDVKSRTTGYTGSRRTFQTTAVHELGHALGLGHENGTYNIMGEDWTHVHCNGSELNWYSGENANQGAVEMYGLNTTRREDVGVVHWRHSGARGEYSDHSRTRVKNSSGSTLATVSGTSGDPVYRVNAGQTVKLEMTLENNGSSPQNPEVGYFLSTNDTITTMDTRLATYNASLGRKFVFTRDQTLTLPSTLVSGKTYYLGAIIDVDDSINEVTEKNNATYVAIRVN